MSDEVPKGDQIVTYEHGAIAPAVAEELAKPPLVTVRGDILAPLLVYMNKFFKCVQGSVSNGQSRFMETENYELSVRLRGFSPEDWNAMMSLAKSAGADLEEVLDRLGGQTPQMAKPELRAVRRERLRLQERETSEEKVARLKAKMEVPVVDVEITPLKEFGNAEEEK